MTTNANVSFEDWEADQMKDPEFRAACEALEPAYQVARLRNIRGLTQAQLAKLVDTKQSSIARLESGSRQPRLSFLRRVVEALGGQLEVRIMSEEEATTRAQPSISTTDQPIAYPTTSIFVPDWPLPVGRQSYLDDHVSAVAL
jgi:transcriptional regulator with XRE-family HTH domain